MRLLLSALLLLGLASCERELFYTYRDYQPKLVVNGLINNQDKISLSVSTAVPCGLCVISPLRSLREPWLRTVSRKARKDSLLAIRVFPDTCDYKRQMASV
jgi:hypothetical protein